MYLPENIKKLIGNRAFTEDSVGMSGSSVILFDDMVLKIEEQSGNTDKTVSVMRRLRGKIPVPEVIAHENHSGKSYLLMSRISGKMSCDEYYLERPKELLHILSEGLKMLWSTDISDFPRVSDIDSELREARQRVEADLVDVSDAEPDTFGENGFESPEALLDWLERNKPGFEPVLSHGDFCLPNIFIKDGQISGFIDLGKTGIGDKWRDIALLYRSLKHNFDGTFGGRIYSDFDPDMLFEELGIKPNREKIRYFILLDELF